jgi:hypothetical protein
VCGLPVGPKPEFELGFTNISFVPRMSSIRIEGVPLKLSVTITWPSQVVVPSVPWKVPE